MTQVISGISEAHTIVYPAPVEAPVMATFSIPCVLLNQWTALSAYSTGILARFFDRPFHR